MYAHKILGASAALALLASKAWAQQAQGCSCTGLDYTNGGSYLIDGTSNNYFTFTSVFNNCQDASITPILVDPSGKQYECTAIESQPDGKEEVAECNIYYSQMVSGQWTVIIQAPDFNFAVQRVFGLTIGSARTVVVTVTPTVYVGYTSTPVATTVTNQIVETDTVIITPDIVTEDCDYATQTILEYLPGPTTTIYTTVARIRTQGAVTSYYQTTLSTWAYCHWPSTWVSPTVDVPPPTQYIPSPTDCGNCRPWYTSSRWTWTPRVTTGYTTLPSSTTRPWTPPVVVTSYTTLPNPSTTPRPWTPPVVTTGFTTLPQPSSSPEWSTVPRPSTSPDRPWTPSVSSGITTIITRPTSSPDRPWTPSVSTGITTIITRPTSSPDRPWTPSVSTGITTIITRPTSSPDRPFTPPVSSTIITISQGGGGGGQSGRPTTTYRTTTEPQHTTYSTTYTNPGRPSTQSPPSGFTPVPSSSSRNGGGGGGGQPTTIRTTVEPRPTSSSQPQQQPTTIRTTVQPRPTSSSPPQQQQPTTVRTTVQPRPTSSAPQQQQPTTIRTTIQPRPTSSSAPQQQHTIQPGGGGSGVTVTPVPVRGGGSGGSSSSGRGRIPTPAADEEVVAPTAVARRSLAALADITSTVAETTYTVTSTIASVAPVATTTENYYYITTTTFQPPAETVCDGGSDETITLLYQGAPQTDYAVQYVTYNTWVTVWVGQTQYQTNTDYNVATRCWQGGGWYGV